MYSAICRLQETEMPSMITGKAMGCHISLFLAAGAPLSSVPALALHSPELNFVFRCFSSVTQTGFTKCQTVPLCASGSTLAYSAPHGTVTFKATSDGSLTQRPQRGWISCPPAATQKQERAGERPPYLCTWRLRTNCFFNGRFHLTRSRKHILPRCAYAETQGWGRNGRVLPAHSWQWQGEEMGRILSTCHAALLLLQGISRNQKIDGEMILCWEQWQTSHSLLQGQDLSLFNKLIMSVKIQLKMGTSRSCATLTFFQALIP